MAAADIELQGLMDESGLRETSISFRSPFHKTLLDSPVFDMLIFTSLFSRGRSYERGHWTLRKDMAFLASR